MPPPYSVATSLPTYDEAEKAKAATMASSSVEVALQVRITPQNECHSGVARTLHGWPHCIFALWLYHCQDEEFPPRDDFSDADQLRVGNDGIFMLAFFSKYELFIFGVELILMFLDCINMECLLLQWPSYSTGSASAFPSV